MARRDFGIGLAFAAVFLALIPLLVLLHSDPRQADFGAYYASGLILREGHGAKLYDLGEQERVQDEVQHRKGLFLNPLPPFHAVIFVPLTRLSLPAAYLTWGLVNILLWVLFFYLVRDEPSMKDRPLLLLLLGCLFGPFWTALIEGQFSAVVLLAFTLAFVFLKRNRDYAAGLGFGLALIKFAIVLPFALIVVVQRKWKFIAGLSSMAGFLTLVSFASVGSTGVIAYIKLMLDMSTNISNEVYSLAWPWKMPTVAGFGSAILRGRVSLHWIEVVSAFVSLLLIVFMAWCWRICEEDPNTGNFDLIFAAALVTSLVTSPHLYTHDLTAMLLAFVIIFGSPQWNARSIPGRLIIFATAILYVSPLYLFNERGLQVVFLLAPVLVVFAFSAVVLAQRGARSVVSGLESGARVE